MVNRPILYASILTSLIAACAASSSSPGTTGGGGDGGTDTGNVSSKGEQANGACPSSPADLHGTKPGGESCSTFADCAPVCCNCATSGEQFLAAACIDGACAAAGNACQAVESSTFCGGGTGGGGAGGGGAGGGGAGGGGA
ncbi:hypothetical protein QHF83_50450, partial [Polyangium sp. 15x6]|nr:hypothetical protein [Polyangium sp. 15x6]